MHEFNQKYYLEQLSDYHRLFYAVFELGKPIYTTKIDTAAVGLNLNTGEINFLINKNFFFNLKESEQLFIICHEAMHILLHHIDRTIKYNLDSDLSNIAQDIVINETLISEFNFARENLDFGVTLCFIDTIFTKEQIKKENIIAGKSFEFYYELLKKYEKEITQNIKQIDFHICGNGEEGNSFIINDNGDIIGEIPSEIADQITNKIGYELTSQELEDVLHSLNESYSMAGSNPAGKTLKIILEKKQKRPWEKLIKNKIATLQKKVDKQQETFRFKPRRIVNLHEDLYLPEIKIDEINKNDKFNIVFFIDSSGSCSKYQNKFFNLVKTVPEEKFNIQLYSFDTETYLLDIKNPCTKGGGGTKFSILEEQIQNLKRNDKTFRKKYPDLIFVLSDGDGDDVQPEKPDRWYFLLTKNQTNCIPQKSNVILLSDFTKNDPKITVKNLERI